MTVPNILSRWRHGPAVTAPRPRLHLGCGQTYLTGYLNIDYPPSEHTVQTTSVADLYANLLELHYASGSIAEVRLHHVFEHFSRATACALLTVWHTWLEPEGLLRIEVPDFGKMARIAGGRRTNAQTKAVALRHIFGSQEAAWALHQHAYTARSLPDLVKLFGFTHCRVQKNNWCGTHNIEVFGYRGKKQRTPGEMRTTASRFLTQFMVDQSDSEQIMLATWMQEYDMRIEAFYPNGWT